MFAIIIYNLLYQGYNRYIILERLQRIEGRADIEWQNRNVIKQW